jgi:hypothetical protein
LNLPSPFCTGANGPILLITEPREEKSSFIITVYKSYRFCGFITHTALTCNFIPCDLVNRLHPRHKPF